MGFGKDGKGAILNEQPNEALLTLASSTGLFLASGDIGASLLERFRIVKTEITAHIQSGTFVAGDGPLGLFMFDGDFSLAEAQLAIETLGPFGPNDTVSEAVVERFSKNFGLIPFIEENVGQGSQLYQGKVLEKTIRWTFARAKGWKWMVYNYGGGLTTGATVKLQAKHFGVWVV